VGLRWEEIDEECVQRDGTEFRNKALGAALTEKTWFHMSE
jgi:hypothetical protein